MDPAIESEFVQLMRSGREPDALALLRRTLEADPADVAAWRHLAAAHGRAGRTTEAEQAYRRLITLGAATAKDRQALGVLLVSARRLAEAVRELREAVRLDPAYATAWCNLGLALEDLGARDEAVEALREARSHAVGEDVPFIEYHLAALGGGPPPAICPPDYLVRLFDGYAPWFENHLVKHLRYRGPWLLRDALAPLLAGRPAGDVIDLGCGTGLCGALVRRVARTLVGVDLSPEMIRHSRERRVYDQLLQLDVTAALLARPASADLILAADVLIYVGDLTPVFRAAASALRPGGLLAFTLEVTDKADFKVEPSRRYAHSLAYVRRVAAEAGLIERHVSSAVLRAGETAPVMGSVVVVSKAVAQA